MKQDIYLVRPRSHFRGLGIFGQRHGHFWPATWSNCHGQKNSQSKLTQVADILMLASSPSRRHIDASQHFWPATWSFLASDMVKLSWSKK